MERRHASTSTQSGKLCAMNGVLYIAPKMDFRSNRQVLKGIRMIWAGKRYRREPEIRAIDDRVEIE